MKLRWMIGLVALALGPGPVAMADCGPAARPAGASPAAACQAGSPVSSTGQALSRDQEAIFEWARGLEALKGDGDFRTMASDEYQDQNYQLGAALLATGADLYALDADCRGLLNYVAHDARAYKLLLDAGYRISRANYVYSPLCDALSFWSGQLEWTRDSDAFYAHYEHLARDLGAEDREPDCHRM